MVTKKTRLLSAIAAVLMLVSMFTSVVLPVSAETEVTLDDLTSVTDLVAGTTNSNGYYSVGSKAELELLASKFSTLGLDADDTIFFTADIDLTEGLEEGTYYTGSANVMDGLIAGLDGRFGPNGTATIKGLNLTSPWLGHYTGGKNIQNLVFDNCRYIEDNTEGRDKDYRPGLIFAGYYDDVTTVTVDTFTLKNITMRDCTVDASASPARVGFMFGRIANATNCEIEDITIVNCSFNPGTNGNVGFLCAEMRTITNPVTVKNIYMNGNVIERVGVTNHNILIGESTISDLTLSNAIVMNTEVPEGVKGYGLFTQKAKGSTYKLNNVVFVNNGAYSSGDYTPTAAKHVGTSSSNSYGGSSVANGCEDYSDKAAGTFNMTGKIYADTEKISWRVDTTAQTEEERTAAYNAVVSGEAAWELNMARASTDAYYTMIADETLGAVPAFGTEAQQTRKVTVKIMDAETDAELAEYTDYTDVDGKLLNTAAYASQANYWTQALDGAIEGDEVIGCVIPDHTCEWENYQSNDDGTHNYECGCKWTVAGVGVVSCGKTQTSECDQSKKLNVTDVNTEEPSLVHMVVSACSLCDYSDPNAVSATCTGTVTEVGRDPIEDSCDLQVFSACNKCDYEHVKTVPGEHSTEYKYQQSATYPQYHEVLCSRCDMFLDLEGHTLNWEVTTPPSVDQEGEKTGTCVCGKTETMVVGAKEGIEVVIEDDVYINQDFDVKVDLKNSSGIMGMQLKINFNKDEVMLVGIENGGDWPELQFGGDIPAGEADDGEVLLNLLNVNNMYMDGTMIVLKFKALNNPENLDKASVITVTAEETWNYDMKAVEVDDTKGTTEVELSIKKGDMNCDGFVNMVDASFLMRYVNEKALDADKHTLDGTTTLITDKMADLTDLGDGEEADDIPNINVDDVIHLLRYLNGQIAL